mgnify:CR=1 FL=1
MFFYDKKIIYLTLVKSGEKTGGAGYLKIEVFNDQCTMEIALNKLAAINQKEYRVWGVSNEKRVNLGIITCESGKGKYKETFAIEKIGKSNEKLTYEELEAILIQLDDARYIEGLVQPSAVLKAAAEEPESRKEHDLNIEEISKWKEVPGRRRHEERDSCRYDECERRDKREEPYRRDERGRREEPYRRDERERREEPYRRDERGRREEPFKRGERNRKEGSLRWDGRGYSGNILRGEEIDRRGDTLEKEKREEREDRVILADSDRKGHSLKEELTGEEEHIRKPVEGEQPTEQNGKQIIDLSSKLKGINEEAVPVQAVGPIPYEELQPEPQLEPQPEMNKWERVRQQYKQIHPYGDDRIYVSLEPKDFVVLPNEYQHLANNSFLLHGYYNYRHIILGMEKKSNDQHSEAEEVYYIGVPGVFYEREKMVAQMFGFEAFECEGGNAEVGKFGYYLYRVSL